jgi:hypothetical protein
MSNKPSKTFLFVNKDASSASLNRSTAREQTSINSHVQRGRRHNRQSNPNSRRSLKERDRLDNKEISPPSLSQSDSSLSLSTSASAPSPSSSSTSSASSSLPVRTAHDGEHSRLSTAKDFLNGEPLDAADDDRIRTAQQTSQDLISIASPAAEVDEHPHSTTGGLLTPIASPADVMQFASNPVDPFANSSIPIDAKTYSLIQYYKHVYHPAVWHVETRATPKGGYEFQTSSADVIKSALQSDVDMYALLACMAARQVYVDRLPNATNSTDEYLGKALAATRRFIMQRASSGPKSHEEILMVIFHLYAAEGYRNNTAAAKIHMKGAKTIVAAIGGLSKLRDPQMRELLIIGDGLLSAMTLQPCELPCEFDPGDYLDAAPPNLRINATYDLCFIAPALRLNLRKDIIPQEIQALLDEIAALQWVLVNAKSAITNASKHAMRWIQMRSMAIRHRLLAYDTDDKRLDVVRASLVLWVVTTTTLLGLKRLSLVIAPQIGNKLRSVGTDNAAWEVWHRDLLAWMLSLGAMSAMPGSEDARWFVGELVGVLQSTGLQIDGGSDPGVILQHLVALQADFFYHPSVHDEYLERLATEICAYGAAARAK